MAKTQEEFIAACKDYPDHDYECLDCDAKIFGVLAILRECSACGSANISYQGVPEGNVQL